MTSDYRPDAFTINNVLYYFADDIKAYFPEIFSFTGSNGVYGIINNGEIKITEYIHAYFTNGRWNTTLEKHYYSKVMVTKEWTENTIQKNSINDRRCLSYIEPPEIIIDENKKFTDTNGRVLEIRVVGNINREHIFFNMDDIININNDVITYSNCITYNKTEKRTRLFYRRKKTNEPLTLSYYFTYYGIIAFLTKGVTFPLLYRLNDWIDRVLLIEDPDVNSQSFRWTCDSLNSTTSAVYLLKLGYVRDLRHKFIIPSDIRDELIIFKHGKTYDIKTEFIFHYNYYKRYWHLDAKLIKYDEFNRYNSYESELLLMDFRKQGVVINCSADVLGNTEMVAVNSSQIIKIYNRFSIDLSHLHEDENEEEKEEVEDVDVEVEEEDVDVEIDETKEIDVEEEKKQEQERNRKIKREKKIGRRRERAIERKREKEDKGKQDEVDVEDIEKQVETVEEVDNFMKTKIENEKKDNSVFKCIIDWFEITLTTFCC